MCNHFGSCWDETLLESYIDSLNNFEIHIEIYRNSRNTKETIDFQNGKKKLGEQKRGLVKLF